MATRQLALVASGLVLGLALTGCGAVADKISERAVEEAAEAAAGGGEVDLDVDEEGGNVSITSSEGSFSIGDAQEVPTDFPGDVPLPDDAEIVSSMTFDDGSAAGFNLSMATDAEVAVLAEDLQDQFTSAGFTITSTHEMALDGQNTNTFGFERSELTGTVTVADGADSGDDTGDTPGTIVGYHVEERAEAS